MSSCAPVVTWSQQALLKASSVRPGDLFGYSVAIAGDTVVVGARSRGPRDDESDGAAESGSAYVFVRTGTSWSQQARLTGADAPGGSNFGVAVAVAGDTVVVGASDERSIPTLAPLPGVAYVFARTGVTWSRQARLQAVYGGAADFFGEAVAVSGDTIIVGAPDGDTAGISTGAAYVFVRTGTTWSLQEHLNASNADEGDAFGASVAIDGDTVVVGATLEGSGATGVNGSAASNDTPRAGAAYAFVRVASRWTQQAYLKASNTDAGDEFGVSVAVSGDMVVVGAALEASSAGGVNVAGDDDSAPWAGAAYVFTRQLATWRQHASLKASNPDTYDLFGLSVAVAGDLVAVGAPFERGSATGVNGAPNNEAPMAGAAYLFVPPADDDHDDLPDD